MGPHGHRSLSWGRPWSPWQTTACLATPTKAASAAPPLPRGCRRCRHEPVVLACRPAQGGASLRSRPDLPHVPGAGGRAPRPAGAAHRHRHAGRCPAGQALAARSRAPLLCCRPLARRPARPGGVRPDRCPVAGGGRADPPGRRRHPVQTHRTEGVWGRLADVAVGSGRRRTAWGNNWVVVGVLVRLPFVAHRMACLPVGGPAGAAPPPQVRPGLPARRADLPAASRPAGASGLRCRRRRQGPAWPAPGRDRHDPAARRRRPPVPAPAAAAARAAGPAPPQRRAAGGADRARRQTSRTWQQATVACDGTPRTVVLHSLVYQWYAVFGAQPVRVILVREPGAPDGDELALVSTDLAATPAELVERSADRWSVEVLFEQSRQVAGVGQARNRTPPHGPAHCPLRPTVREPGRLLVRPARPASRRPLPSTAPVRPGIPPSTPSRWLTCSTRSAASYWPPNFCHLAWSHPPWKNSSTRRQPGPPTRCKVRNSSLGMGVCNIRWRRATR
jgi:hypothetical protein